VAAQVAGIQACRWQRGAATRVGARQVDGVGKALPVLPGVAHRHGDRARAGRRRRRRRHDRRRHDRRRRRRRDGRRRRRHDGRRRRRHDGRRRRRHDRRRRRGHHRWRGRGGAAGALVPGRQVDCVFQEVHLGPENLAAPSHSRLSRLGRVGNIHRPAKGMTKGLSCHAFETWCGRMAGPHGHMAENNQGFTPCMAEQGCKPEQLPAADTTQRHVRAHRVPVVVDDAACAHPCACKKMNAANCRFTAHAMRRGSAKGPQLTRVTRVGVPVPPAHQEHGERAAC